MGASWVATSAGALLMPTYSHRISHLLRQYHRRDRRYGLVGEGSDAAVVVRAALLSRVDAHFSAIASDFQVAENLLRAGRCLYLLGNLRPIPHQQRAVPDA